MPNHRIMQARLHLDAFRATASSLRLSDRNQSCCDKPQVRIRILGDLAISVDDREIVLPCRKAKAMIAYLVLAPGMRETRDRLVGLLWSETEDTNARASLRQLLYSLRITFEAAGLAGLSVDKSGVRLDPSMFRTDLDDFLDSVDRGYPMDVQLNLGEISSLFLCGYDDIDPSFATWMTVKRENVRRMLIQNLEARLTDVPNRPDETKRLARALVQIDPTHEIACQKLMKAYIDLGSTASALAVYKQLWEHLEEEYDIEPSAATQELAVAIRNAQHMPGVDPLRAPVDPASEGAVDTITSLAIKFAVAWMTARELNHPTEQGVAQVAGALPGDWLVSR